MFIILILFSVKCLVIVDVDCLLSVVI